MRSLKFRAWDIDKQEYITYFEISCEGCVWTQEPECDPDYPNVILEQYTGLKDKNGKEIYEGDVVDVWIGGCKQDTPYVVEDMRELYSEFHHDDGYYQFSEVEIIGNIHENPELVKEEE